MSTNKDLQNLQQKYRTLKVLGMDFLYDQVISIPHLPLMITDRIPKD